MRFLDWRQKQLKMIWEVEKGSIISLLVGTAHFFPHSFRRSCVRLFRDARVILFEGPLDPESLSKVVQAGFQDGTAPHLFDSLDAHTIQKIANLLFPVHESSLRHALAFLPRISPQAQVLGLIKGMKPWMAFFTLWTSYLKKRGWVHSVDLEAYRTALDFGKRVVTMETIDEQIEVLETISLEKIVDFLKRVDHWEHYTRQYVKHYLDGNLDGLLAMATFFPSRVSSVIEDRDGRFYERMREHLDDAGAVVFVGSPHVRGICEMLSGDGYTVRQRPC